MNAIELLRQDHRTVRGLFSDLEAAGDGARAEKQRIGERIFNELAVHTQIEEEIFYPAARDGAGRETDRLVAEAYEEHQVAKRLIAAVKNTPPANEQWDAKMMVLKENIEDHVQEEEGDLFPRVHDSLGSSYLTELGDKMAARKQELSKSGSSLGESIVNLVSRAYDSLTGNGKARPRRAAAGTNASARVGTQREENPASRKTATKRKARGSAAGATRSKQQTTRGQKRAAPVRTAPARKTTRKGATPQRGTRR